MFLKPICTTVMFLIAAVAVDDEKQTSMINVLVDVQDREFIENATSAKLNISATLLAVKEANGVLKGADGLGKRAIIEASPEGVEKLRSSRIVRSVSTDVPEKWNPVFRLKLSYEAGNSLTDEDLKSFGVKLIEDYEKGSFVIAELVGDQMVDAKLISKLKENKKILFATAVFRVKAIQNN